ncbi:MAG: ABC transporter permease, partial [Nitrososphaerota archaeon]
RNIFMRQGFLITGLGAVSGVLIGLFICWLQIKFHLVKFGEGYIMPYYPIEVEAKDLVWVCGLIMFIGFFAALYPVRVFTRKANWI